jgi:hypothetical protein
MLNLALNPLCNAWEELKEELSLFETSLGEEIVSENLEEEIKLTKEKGDVTYQGERWVFLSLGIQDGNSGLPVGHTTVIQGQHYCVATCPRNVLELSV